MRLLDYEAFSVLWFKKILTTGGTEGTGEISSLRPRERRLPRIVRQHRKNFAFLLGQPASEQNPQRADVAAQRKFFRGIGGIRRQLRNAVGLSAIAPEGIVGHGIF